MKKLINAVIAAAALLACALPCYAAEVSPVTGDITMYVVIALIVAAVAIVGTLIYSKFKKIRISGMPQPARITSAQRQCHSKTAPENPGLFFRRSRREE